MTAGLLAFWLIAGLAAWVQTMVGFGLGLILMGGAGLIGAISLPQAAAATSILVIMNGCLVLMRDWRGVDRPALVLVLLGAMPGLILGYLLLNWLAGTSLGLLQLLLGLVIAGSALQLAWRPRAQATRSGAPSFVLTGLLGGMMGGLFATSGPPIIWQLYRQPLPLATVRLTLVAVFLLTQILRIGLVIGSGNFGAPILVAAAGAAPAVALGTWLARSHPPRVAPETIRRAALALLFLTGLTMIAAGLT